MEKINRKMITRNILKAPHRMSVMFWGCISHNCVSILVDGNINLKRDIDILNKNFLPVFAKEQRNFVVMLGFISMIIEHLIVLEWLMLGKLQMENGLACTIPRYKHHWKCMAMYKLKTSWQTGINSSQQWKISGNVSLRPNLEVYMYQC